jgi:hypothetical protein
MLLLSPLAKTRKPTTKSAVGPPNTIRNGQPFDGKASEDWPKKAKTSQNETVLVAGR